jgi:hypothetical protein
MTVDPTPSRTAAASGLPGVGLSRPAVPARGAIMMVACAAADSPRAMEGGSLAGCGSHRHCRAKQQRRRREACQTCPSAAVSTVPGAEKGADLGRRAAVSACMGARRARAAEAARRGLVGAASDDVAPRQGRRGRATCQSAPWRGRPRSREGVGRRWRAPP